MSPLLPSEALDSKTFMQLLHGFRPNERARALGFLLRMGRFEVVPILRSDLAKAVGEDRFWVARALVPHDESAVEMLRMLYAEDAEEVPRHWILSVLERNGLDAVADELRKEAE